MIVASLVSGCSSAGAGYRKAFSVQTGFSARFPATTGDTIDLGLPHLYNTSDSTVRLVDVQLVNAPAGVHVINVSAYLYATSDGGVIAALGALPTRCPSKYVPHPVQSVTTGPNDGSPWYVVLALRVPKPGHYWLGRLRIDYDSSGHKHWQYQNIDTTLIVKRGAAETFPASACSPPPS
jgi:hypothetical protein